MKMLNPASSWSIESVRAALPEGRNPRDAGGEDARRNKPPPGPNQLPAFVSSVQSNGEYLCHGLNAWAESQFIELASALRSNPSAIASPKQRAQAVLQAVDDEMNTHIEHAYAEFDGLGHHKADAGEAYRRSLQAADTEHPAGGWSGPEKFWRPVLIADVAETAVGTIMLWHEIGLTRAAATAFVLSAVSLLGGCFCSLALLRPTTNRDRKWWRRKLQWMGATLIGLVTFSAMYLGGVMRTVWIAGLDGGVAEISAKIRSPAEVLVNWEVAVLALLGIAGFYFAARETNEFYAGFGRALRKSGLAESRATYEHFAMAEALKAFVEAVAHDGNLRLSAIETEHAAWARAAADAGDGATVVKLTVNRNTDVVRGQVDRIAKEYREGYAEIRPFDCIGEIPASDVGVKIETPAAFGNVRHAARDDFRAVPDLLRQARAGIREIERKHIERIDRIGGFRPQEREAKGRLSIGIALP